MLCRDNDMRKTSLNELRQFYEKLAEEKGDMDEYWAKGFYQSLLIEKIHKILNNVHGKRIIDVGCGDGRTVLYLMERENSVVGVDISYTRLSRAKKKVFKHSNNTLLMQSYAEYLPVKPKTFDYAICTEVLEHVIDDESLLGELSNALRPNSWALISIPTVSLRRYFEMWYGKKPIYFCPTEHIREFTYYKIPWFENDFILIKDLEKKLKTFDLNLINRYGIGFELPLWITKFKLGQFLERFCNIKKVNKFLSALPILKNFGVYTIFILRKGT